MIPQPQLKSFWRLTVASIVAAMLFLTAALFFPSCKEIEVEVMNQSSEAIKFTLFELDELNPDRYGNPTAREVHSGIVAPNSSTTVTFTSNLKGDGAVQFKATTSAHQLQKSEGCYQGKYLSSRRCGFTIGRDGRILSEAPVDDRTKASPKTYSEKVLTNADKFGYIPLERLVRVAERHRELAAITIDELKKRGEYPAEFFGKFEAINGRLALSLWHESGLADTRSRGNPGGKSRNVYFDGKNKVEKMLLWR